jgi:hypothetical protein
VREVLGNVLPGDPRRAARARGRCTGRRGTLASRHPWRQRIASQSDRLTGRPTGRSRPRRVEAPTPSLNTPGRPRVRVRLSNSRHSYMPRRNPAPAAEGRRHHGIASPRLAELGPDLALLAARRTPGAAVADLKPRSGGSDEKGCGRISADKRLGLGRVTFTQASSVVWISSACVQFMWRKMPS